MANNTIKSIQFKRGTKLALETVLIGEKKPLAGEPCWENDTNKLKIGDGVHNYGDLPYLTDGSSTYGVVIVGYYKDNGFYQEESCKTLYPRYRTKLYLDKFTDGVYYYSEDGLYHKLVQECQVDDGKAGLVKLYGYLGKNTDGAVTQKLFTEKYEELLYNKIGIDTSELDKESVGFVITSKDD